MADTGLPEVPKPGAAKEPLITVGGITTVVTAVLVLLVAYGINVNNNQQAAILGVVAVLAPIVVAVIGRLKTWSPRSVRRVVQQAVAEERGRHRAPDTANTDVRVVRADDFL